MKKLVLFFAAAMFAVTFAACGNKAAQNNEETTETNASVEVVENTPATDVEVEGEVAPEGTPEVAE